MTLARLRVEARDLIEFVLIPGLAALLPWSLCFRLFRLLCRADSLYRDTCEVALAHALEMGWVRGDPAAWKRRYRLVLLVDHADFYLARFRSDRWMKRHLLVSGTWPDPHKAGILCTFHWGAGMWALRHLAAQGLKVHLLVAPDARAAFAGRTIGYWYYRQRIRAIPRALRREPIEATRTPRAVLTALRSDEQVAAVVDVPADQAVATEPIELLGLRTRVPRALMRLACEAEVPVTVYLCGIRLGDGTRELRIYPFGVREDAQSLIRDVFALLDAAIEEEAAAWHFWSVAPRFFAHRPPGH